MFFETFEQQVGEFYRHVLDEGARDRLTSNIAGNLIAAQVGSHFHSSFISSRPFSILSAHFQYYLPIFDTHFHRS
jgi:hypothetical protein